MQLKTSHYSDCSDDNETTLSDNNDGPKEAFRYEIHYHDSVRFGVDPVRLMSEGQDKQHRATGEHPPLRRRRTGTDAQAIPAAQPQGEQHSSSQDLPHEAEDQLPDQLDTNK